MSPVQNFVGKYAPAKPRPARRNIYVFTDNATAAN
jgi:hypothetical protein